MNLVGVRPQMDRQSFDRMMGGDGVDQMDRSTMCFACSWMTEFNAFFPAIG
jgi:hypothetical protein